MGISQIGGLFSHTTPVHIASLERRCLVMSGYLLSGYDMSKHEYYLCMVPRQKNMTMKQ